MWELDYKESWELKNWCFWTVVLEKTLESPLDCKEIQPVHPKGNQSWVFIGRTDAEAEAPILWPPVAKNWLIWKDPDAGKDWRQEEKGMTADEMVGWHHWLDEHEFEQASGVGDGQGSLACCSPWGRKDLDMTEWLNWTELTELLGESIVYKNRCYRLTFQPVVREEFDCVFFLSSGWEKQISKANFWCGFLRCYKKNRNEIINKNWENRQWSKQKLIEI